MADQHLRLPSLFLSNFTVEETAPFRRHLNRLEVEIGREDYRHLKRVELLPESPSEADFREMEEITERIIATTQNNYNRDLLRRQRIRVYLDIPRYQVYYRLADRTLRFTAAWRQQVLRRFFAEVPVAETGWRHCRPPLAGFDCLFLPDRAGGVLLLREREPVPERPLLTATHGPYDPHTLEVTLYFLLSGKGGAAVINLGFSGREPLTDGNLERLKKWGVPLNPSNIDAIYPYADAAGHPFCYKLEEGLGEYVALLGAAPPLIIDIHGCVGTWPEDDRVIVGLGGFPPFPQPEELGETETQDDTIHLRPRSRLRQGLELLRELSAAIHLQFCSGPHCGYHFRLQGGLRLAGRALDPRAEVDSLLPGEERTWLPGENIRWLPGAGGNALQRLAARRLRPDALCLHVEIPTRVRRGIAMRLREMAISTSLESSSL